AVIGNSPNANGTVNVTGPNAIFFSTPRDIVVGKQGTGNLTVTDGGSFRVLPVSSLAITGGPEASRLGVVPGSKVKLTALPSREQVPSALTIAALPRQTVTLSS